MSIPIVIVSENGLEPAPYRAESLREAAAIEPPGVYTVTRTYPGGRVVLLESHLDRLADSARLEGIPVRFDRSLVRSGLRELVQRFEGRSSRARMTVPRSNPEQVILAIEPLDVPPEHLKKQGVAAATVQLRRTNPRAKSNAWEHRRQEAMQALPEGVYEGLLVDEQALIREGFTSNFYAVKHGTIYTAAEDVLLGISRKILLSTLPEDQPFKEDPVRLDEIADLEESFLTSSSRGVVPIVKIDDVQLGDGRPGPVTQLLSERYDQWVYEHLEEI
ncbi:MAG: aminotransferase class IV [Anaerolineales bacterium]|nr:aminotransferase class IV [Anaerolineales bacterium]